MDELTRFVFLSIRPKWAEKILAGEKKFEYRRSAPTIEAPFKILLYATDGKSEIVGEASVDRVFSDEIQNLMDRTISETPHTRSEIEEYFSGLDVGQALRITQTVRYDSPIGKAEIENTIDDFRPPQNFLYVTPNDHPQFFELIPTFSMQTKEGNLNQFEQNSS